MEEGDHNKEDCPDCASDLRPADFLDDTWLQFLLLDKGIQEVQTISGRVRRDFMFPAPHRVLFDTPSAGSVLALLLLVLFTLLIWFVAYKRLRRSFPTGIPVAASKLAFNHGDGDTALPPWEGRQL
jgi:hypothetical protein